MSSMPLEHWLPCKVGRLFLFLIMWLAHEKINSYAQPYFLISFILAKQWLRICDNLSQFRQQPQG